MSPDATLLIGRVLAIVVFVGCAVYLFKRPDAPKTLMASGGAIIGLVTRWKDIQTHLVASLPDWPAPWLLGGGVVLVVIGLVGQVTPIDATQKRIRRIFRDRPLRSRPARSKELMWVREFASSYFGTGVTPLESMRRWHEKYKSVFILLEEVDRAQGRTQSTIHGYHCMIPLTSAAARLVADEQVDGTTILADHVSSTLRDAAAVYIGGVAGKGRRARAAILADLYARIDDLQERRIPIYTRPITDDGLRLVNDYPFVPVDPKVPAETLKRIYRLDWGDGQAP